MVQYARAACLISLSALLGACASAGTDYPSLAVRDAERAEGQFETGEPQRIDVPPVEVDLTGGLEARLASLVAAAEDAHSRFDEARPRAERLVAAARGSAVGSDSWAAAQVALAELDSARSLTAVPLGDLDAIYAATLVAADDSAAVEAARSGVIALVNEEDSVLEDLRAQVR
ncbi:hypothetical protein [Erythrobacter sp. SD-21]|uniref:hypothetical protein n=1 Tax=Erythrobacter sp. SD-21 TaxID=161528 RepID=UPI000153F4B0|nr:hypothetical protein [Erythrobacter sp. SD-21]EDL49014.1 hypothetical protein ED21_24826 [Erythrobacter sp. SD-21]